MATTSQSLRQVSTRPNKTPLEVSLIKLLSVGAEIHTTDENKSQCAHPRGTRTSGCRCVSPFGGRGRGLINFRKHVSMLIIYPAKAECCSGGERILGVTSRPGGEYGYHGRPAGTSNFVFVSPFAEWCECPKMLSTMHKC